MKNKKKTNDDFFFPLHTYDFYNIFVRFSLNKNLTNSLNSLSLNNLLYELVNIINTFLILPLTDLFQVADTGKDKLMETVLIRAEIIFRSEIRVMLCVIILPTFLIFFKTSSFHVCTVTP